MNFGLDPKAYWLKLEVHSPSVHAEKYILTNLFFYTDELTVYSYEEGHWKSYQGGDALYFSERPLVTPSVSIPLLFQPGRNAIYIRIFSRGAHQVDLRLFQETAYWSFLFQEQMYLGFLSGLHIVVAIISAFFYWSLRDKTYLYLSIHSLFNLAYNGFSIGVLQWVFYKLFSWDLNSPQLALVSVAFTIITIIFFCNAYFDVKKESKHWFYWNRILVVVHVFLCIFLYISLYEATALIVIMAGVVTLSVLAQAYHFVYRNKPLSRYFAIAWTSYLITSAATAGNLIGWIPSFEYTYLSQFTFGSIQMVVLLVSAVIRVNYLRSQLENSQALQNQLGTLVRHAQFMEVSADPKLRESFHAVFASHAAELVGGDFLGIKTEGNISYIVIGDVNGHGMHSAMVSMIASGIIRGAISQTHQHEGEELNKESVRALMLSINRALISVREVYDRVLTLCIVAINLKDGRAYYTNGGHCPILIKGQEGSRSIVRKGSILGMHENPQITVYEMALQPSDMILAITDGMIETKNKKGKTYNFKNLKQCLLQSESPEQVQDSIEKDQVSLGLTCRQDDASYLIFQWHGIDPRLKKEAS